MLMPSLAARRGPAVVRTTVIAMLDAEGASAAPGRVESIDIRAMKVRLLPTGAGISIRLKA